jgi:hypothetical protein
LKPTLLAPSRAVAGLACALLLALSAASQLRAESLESITLRYRTAEELLPVLQPLVPPGAALTGSGDLLLVRADAAVVQQLRAAVATLDRAPRQLLITVGQAMNTRGAGTSVRGSGTLASGNVQVGVNSLPQPTTSGQVVVRSGTTSDEMRTMASVRALEGHESYIALGQSRPFTSTTVVGGGRHYPPVVSQATDYREAQSGFYATPRVNGDRVTLEVSPSQQRFTGNSPRDGSVMTGSVATTVTGRLGEWLEIGGTTETGGGSQSGIINWGTRSDLTQYSAWIKVEEIR